jgi:hypothetical protein
MMFIGKSSQAADLLALLRPRDQIRQVSRMCGLIATVQLAVGAAG